MNTRNVSFILGITFVLVGLLGFVPNPLVSPNGLFAVNTAHNLVHIATGAVFLLGAIRFPGREGIFIKGVGTGYVLVAILGFLTPNDMLLGLVHINQADRWLHFGLAIGILAAGFLVPQSHQRLLAESK